MVIVYILFYVVNIVYQNTIGGWPGGMDAESGVYYGSDLARRSASYMCLYMRRDIDATYDGDEKAMVVVGGGADDSNTQTTDNQFIYYQTLMGYDM